MHQKEVHLSQGPDNSPVTYVIVSKQWKIMATVLLYIGLVFAIALTIAVYQNIIRLNEDDVNEELIKERNKALGEMTIERGRIQRWMYSELCERAKKENRPCLENPRWWVREQDFPKLVGTSYAAGLFEHEK